MLETVRGRLTAWYVSVLAVVLAAFSVGVYAFLARSLHAGVDEGLQSVLEVAATSLTHDTAEGQDPADAARSTVAELSNRLQRLAIHDGGGERYAAGRVITGRDAVIALHVRLGELHGRPVWFDERSLNGLPAVVVRLAARAWDPRVAR